jgi:hypothetical protein
MGLGVPAHVVDGELSDASDIYVSWVDVTGAGEVPKPLRGEGVDLVVEGAHVPS